MKLILLELVFITGFFIAFSFRSIVLLRFESIKEMKSILHLKLSKLLFPSKDFKKLIIQLLHAVFTGYVLSFLADKILFENHAYPLWIKLLIFCVTSIIILMLIYLSAFDIEFFEVPNKLSLLLVIILVIINLGLLPLYGISNSLILWPDHHFYPFANLVAGSLAGFAIFALVFLTKGKGMGDGDIRIAGILGLILGMQKIVLGFYVTILSSSFVGIAYSIYLRKFRGVKIPFVPFIVLGTIIPLLYSHEIVSLVFGLF